MHCHEGSITALRFYGTTHMLSASDDGQIHIYRTKDWEKLSTLHGHRGPVLDLAIHPTGKLALSIGGGSGSSSNSTGGDGTLRMWDLLKGRCAYTTKLRTHKESEWNRKRGFRPTAERVYWSPSGDRYAVLYNDRVDLRMVAVMANASAEAAIPSLEAGSARQRFLCLGFGVDAQGRENGLAYVGCEDGRIRCWRVDGGAPQQMEDATTTTTSTPTTPSTPTTTATTATATAAAAAMVQHEWLAHTSRVRDLALTVSDGRVLLCSLSSDGHIKVWDVTEPSVPSVASSVASVVASVTEPSVTVAPRLLADHSCGTRLTCLAIQHDPPVAAPAAATAAAIAVAATAPAESRTKQQKQQRPKHQRVMTGTAKAKATTTADKVKAVQAAKPKSTPAPIRHQGRGGDNNKNHDNNKKKKNHHISDNHSSSKPPSAQNPKNKKRTADSGPPAAAATKKRKQKS